MNNFNNQAHICREYAEKNEKLRVRSDLVKVGVMGEIGSLESLGYNSLLPLLSLLSIKNRRWKFCAKQGSESAA